MTDVQPNPDREENPATTTPQPDVNPQPREDQHESGDEDGERAIGDDGR